MLLLHSYCRWINLKWAVFLLFFFKKCTFWDTFLRRYNAARVEIAKFWRNFAHRNSVPLFHFLVGYRVVPLSCCCCCLPCNHNRSRSMHRWEFLHIVDIQYCGAERWLVFNTRSSSRLWRLWLWKTWYNWQVYNETICNFQYTSSFTVMHFFVLKLKK